MYAPADFMVIETGTDERAPIILGRLFLNTSRAVIYASAAKISFYNKGKKETLLQILFCTMFHISPPRRALVSPAMVIHYRFKPARPEDNRHD